MTMTQKQQQSGPTSTASNQPSSMGFAQEYALKYYLFLAPFLVALLVYRLTNKTQVALAVVLILPNIGHLLPLDDQSNTHSKEINSSIKHSIPLVLNAVTVWLTLAYFWTNYASIAATTSSLIAGVICLGFLTSSSIQASHEMIHRPQLFFRLVGFVHLAVFQFTTYPVQHLYLHHKHVGTSADPITSEKGNNLYLFSAKAVCSSYRFTYSYSKPFFALCLVLNWSYLGLQFALAYRESHSVSASLCKIFFFLVSAAISLLLMEAVEYIQHYGLIYENKVDKRDILERSSWNTTHNTWSNWIGFRFQRHSDHHMNAYKTYSTLELTEVMPLFPFDFIQAVLFSLIPPLWWAVADPLVDAQLANTKPSKEHLRKVKQIIGAYTATTTIVLVVWAASS